jgi:tricorn protease-like protein
VVAELALPSNEGPVVVEFSSDDLAILYGDGGDLTLVDAKTAKSLRTFAGVSSVLYGARMTPNGKYVIGANGERTTWATATGKVVNDAEMIGLVRRVSLSADGTKVLAASWEKDVRLWDVVTGKELGGFTMKKSFVNGVALSCDGKLAACGGSDGVVRIIDPISGAVQKAVTGKGWIDVIERSDDGRFFASAGREAQVIVWDWQGNKIRTLSDFKSGITALALSPDGRWAAASGKTAAPMVWSLDTGKLAAVLKGHEKVTAVGFSRNSRRLVTGGTDCVRVWELPE